MRTYMEHACASQTCVRDVISTTANPLSHFHALLTCNSVHVWLQNTQTSVIFKEGCRKDKTQRETSHISVCVYTQDTMQGARTHGQKEGTRKPVDAQHVVSCQAWPVNHRTFVHLVYFPVDVWHPIRPSPDSVSECLAAHQTKNGHNTAPHAQKKRHLSICMHVPSKGERERNTV
jgi:hypothetical protein